MEIVHFSGCLPWSIPGRKFRDPGSAARSGVKMI